MARDTSFKDYILGDVLAFLGNLRAKAMFGGYGIYWHENFVALIAAGELFTKANPELKAKYCARGCHPFSYAKKDGSLAEMNYMSVPEEVMEDQELLRERFRESLDLALQQVQPVARKSKL